MENQLNNLMVQTFTGTVRKIIYENTTHSDFLFSIFTVDITSKNFEWDSETINVLVASAPPVEGKAEYRFYGKVDEHKKYGLRFCAEGYIRCLPLDNEGAVEYLGSGLFKGIGIKRAEQIVDIIGDDCIVKIINDPNILLNVKGINKKSIETIHQSLIENLGLYKMLPRLSEWKINLSKMINIYKQFGDASIKKIEDNPYCLANNIKGIGFKKADEIAKSMDVDGKDLKRINGAIEFILHDIYNRKGSTYATKEYLIKKVKELLEEQDDDEYSTDFLEDALDCLIGANTNEEQEEKRDIGIIMESGNRIYLAKYYNQEIFIARKLLNYHHNDFTKPYTTRKGIIENSISQVEAYLKKKLTYQQRKAIIQAMELKLSIITGGPGTGKTMIVNGIAMAYVSMHNVKSNKEFLDRIILLAPTGRAADRLSKSTGIPAQTIHRFVNTLENANEEGKSVVERLIIVDEMSMVGMEIMTRILNELSVKDRIVLIGDEEQLPSINAGNILNDLLISNTLTITRLTETFRQHKESDIVKLANQIREKEENIIVTNKMNDVRFVEVPRDAIINQLLDTLKTLTDQGFSLLDDIQVIAPIQKSAEGIISINHAIQDALLNGDLINNQNDLILTSFESNGYVFCIGDKVMHKRNDSKKGVLNGDIGVVTGVAYENSLNGDEDSSELIVQYDGFEVSYTQNELEDLTLAYCFSVHKSQGSEYPIVIIPFSKSYKKMLSRSLIYTAITRAQKSVIMLGDSSLFDQGIKTESYVRYTSLNERLQAMDK